MVIPSMDGLTTSLFNFVTQTLPKLKFDEKQSEAIERIVKDIMVNFQ